MNEVRIIKESISDIIISDKQETIFSYKKYFYLFWIIKIPITPCYENIWGDNYTEEDLLNTNNYLIEDNIVYIKPKIVFNTKSNKHYTLKFNTIQDCYKYLEDNEIDKIPQIILYGYN